MKLLRKTILLCVVFASVVLIAAGCVSGSNSNRGPESAPAHSKGYYEGLWVCSGFEHDGTVISFNALIPEARELYPYLLLTLEDGKLGGVMEIENGSGDPKTLLMGEWEPISEGVRIDDARFQLEGSRLVAEQSDALLYFERIIPGDQLYVGTIRYNDVSFDAPIELVYLHDGISPDADGYGVASSYRADGPSLYMAAKSTDLQDITEAADYFAGYEDCFTSVGGINCFVLFDEENLCSDVEFVYDGNWYTIEFHYSNEDVVEYSEYAETFYTTLRIGDAENSYADGDSAGSSEAGGETAVPAGAISWQDASQHIGELVTVYGSVVGSNCASSSNGAPTFLDLGAAYPNESRVSVVIWGEDRPAFPEAPEAMYAGQTVCVTGVIYVYNDVCNIEVTSPSQIQVL